MNEEQHIELCWGGTSIPMIRRPVSVPATERTIALIDFGTRGRIVNHRAGMFKNGEWRGASGAKLKNAPKFWTELVKPEKSDATT
jgi:hypothetical protein